MCSSYFNGSLFPLTMLVQTGHSGCKLKKFIVQVTVVSNVLSRDIKTQHLLIVLIALRLHQLTVISKTLNWVNLQDIDNFTSFLPLA